MRIILGLGNPGPEYVVTRHNAGVMLVDKIQDSRFKIQGEYGWRKHYGAMICKSTDLILVKSLDVFMNESGRLLQGLPEGELWVAHDDLDIKLGEYKIQKGTGPKEHGGVNSIEAAFGKEFWRIRMGIDNRSQALGIKYQGEEYVLQRFLPEEREVLDGVFDEIINSSPLAPLLI